MRRNWATISVSLPPKMADDFERVRRKEHRTRSEFVREALKRFYEEVIGLQLIERFENAAFLKLADGYGGHTQVLALFDRKGQAGYAGLNPLKTTVDHIAFEIGLADFAAEKDRLQGLGLGVTTAEHSWVHWRSLYVRDPEGHSVELVCFDPTVN